MTKTLSEVKNRRKQIYEIANKYGIKDICVFGSVARGEEKNGSDIDFLVTQDKGVSLFEVVRFRRKLEDFLKEKTDVILEDGISKFLRDSIFNESVAI